MFALRLVSLALLATFVASEPLVKRAATNAMPSSPTSISLNTPITVRAGETFSPEQDYTKYDRGSGACGGQTEGGDADAVFILEEGATLNRVVIGKDQSEGVHCTGSCTLNDVWFEDVCEDAITIKQESGTSRINNGGAFHASDKVIQHNGGGTVVVNSFYVEDFGKLYRSCGNCGTQHERHVQISDVWAVDGSLLAGINSNYGDTATIRTTQVASVNAICEIFEGNDTGDEPTSLGKGPDSTNCLYSESDITQL